MKKIGSLHIKNCYLFPKVLIGVRTKLTAPAIQAENSLQSSDNWRIRSFNIPQGGVEVDLKPVESQMLWDFSGLA